MGVLKLANDVNKYANNPTFKGVGLTKSTPTMADTVTELTNNVTSSVVFSVASKVLPRFNPYLLVASTLYDIGTSAYQAYKNYTSAPPTIETANEPVSIDDKKVPVKDIPEKTLEKIIAQKQSDIAKVKDETQIIYDNFVSYNGTNLPDTMKSNTSALVQSVNALTNALTLGLSESNIGILALTQAVSNLSSLMEYSNEQNLKSKAVDLNVSTNPNISVNFPDLMNVKTDFSDSFNEILGLKKQEIPKQIEKADLQIDDLTYKKTATAVKDLDGQTVASISPREAELVKNATVAKKTTDQNNLELDEGDFDILSNIDISSIFGFEKTSIEEEQILKTFFKGV
jgi:hypothetical protein